MDMRMVLGMEGVGCYWSIIEMLYEEGGFMRSHYDRIAFELHTDENVIKQLIEDFELFGFDEEKIWSESVLERLKIRKDKSIKASKSAEKKWEKYRNANAVRTHSERNANKVKESKVKINNNPPDLPYNLDFKNTWDEWERYRLEIKKPLTPIAKSQQLKFIIGAAGGDERRACEILQQSMRNGWQGLFELKDSPKPQIVRRVATSEEHLTQTL